MSRAKLAAAQELLKEKRFSEARAVLETIPNDPTAQKWLEKLGDKRSKSGMRWMNYGIVAVVAMIPALIIGLFIGRGSTPLPQMVFVTVIPTAIPTNPIAELSPVPPTRDCGAYDWWNASGGFVQSFMSFAKAVGEMSGDDIGGLGYDQFVDAMSENQDAFDAVTPPLCAHNAQLLVNNAMLDYTIAFRERALNKAGIDNNPNSTPEIDLEKAKEHMLSAADAVEQLTDLDTSFMRD